MIVEDWKDIPGYKGLYRVSSFGRIKSLKKNIIMKPILQSNGYCHIGLNNGVQKQFRLHRIIANTFIPNPENKPQVNHKDGNKQNNRIENLEWNTPKENMNHAMRTGLNRPSMIGRFGADHNTSKPCLQISSDGFLLAVYGSQYEAMRQTGICQTTINKCSKGKIKMAGGYIWK